MSNGDTGRGVPDGREEWFKTIAAHWAHYLAHDMPPDAPKEQVFAMKRAFAAGAISGLQLALLELQAKPTPGIMAHIKGINELGEII